jgi:pyrroloquinoline quinone biosynthesis protein E
MKSFMNKQIVKSSKPNWMLAELTYRCPLSCPYCSNPVDIVSRNKELSTNVWKQNIKNASKIGVAQIGFSGGEPLSRPDLEELVECAASENMYTNLITSSVGLTSKRLEALKNAGLNSIQISFQADTKELNDFIAKNNTFEHKLETAKAIKAAGFPLTFNVVLHRLNSDRIEQILEMAINELGADFIELANTQFYGWAFNNKEALLPTKEQVLHTQKVTKTFIDKYADRTKILYVISDYYEGRPKGCMGGWGNDIFVITPDGYILPCHSARIIPGLEFPQITEDNILDLGHVWYESELFNKFRGFEWMQEPCKTCDERFTDFGGCRCQALLLAGDASATDPVCSKSPLYNSLKDTMSGYDHETKFEFRKNPSGDCNKP